MRDRIFAAVFSLVFIALLIWCPGLSVLSKLDVVELPENKNVKLPEKSYSDGVFLSSALNAVERTKADLENIYANCLPFYEDITKFMLDNERSMREVMLETLYGLESVRSEETADDAGEESFSGGMKPETASSDGAEAEITQAEENLSATQLPAQYKAKLIGADGINKTWAFTEIGSDYSEGWTDKTLVAGEIELSRRLEIQIGHVNRIARANTDVNFYVYTCTRFQETEVFGEIISDIRAMSGEMSTKSLMDEFLSGLDMTAVTDYDIFKIDTLEKRLDNIFKTDHHESAKGAYNIYSDIINMITGHTPEIGKPHELIKMNVFGDIQLRGSHVWGYRYSEIFDVFADYDVDLPPHKMYSELNGTNETERQYERYMNGRYGTDLFNDHYANYYPKPAKVVYPENKTGRNLLILGDSYTWAAGELIASNFDTTYITLWTHGRFDYNEFIKENNITDVMIMQVADRLLYDIQNDTQLGRVITENEQ